MNVTSVFMLLGLATMAVSPFAEKTDASFAFGAGMALPWMWRLTLESFRGLRKRLAQ
jgi:hypothetical protein